MRALRWPGSSRAIGGRRDHGSDLDRSSTPTASTNDRHRRGSTASAGSMTAWTVTPESPTPSSVHVDCHPRRGDHHGPRSSESGPRLASAGLARRPLLRSGATASSCARRTRIIGCRAWRKVAKDRARSLPCDDPTTTRPPAPEDRRTASPGGSAPPRPTPTTPSTTARRRNPQLGRFIHSTCG